MDPTFSWIVGAETDPLEVALVEIDAAIALVRSGAARTVRLCGLRAAERAAVTGAARAQTAGVEFLFRRETGGSITLVIGPDLRQRESQARPRRES
ncbi:MAG TPA: hypothetical protein VGC90_01325 [Candidatus Limnocylindrales bacterium]